jgi:hypothetical protein
MRATATGSWPISNPTPNATLDAAGNSTGFNAEMTDGWTATHDLAGRLSGGYAMLAYGPNGYVLSSYKFMHNADGQRMAKTITLRMTCPGIGQSCTLNTTQLATVFVYDHRGRLLGEYSGSTGAVTERS